MHGIAREVSALTRTPLKHPSIQPVAPHINDVLPVTIHSPDLCGRFSGRIIKGLNPSAKTPDWMVQRLARCGQRSISALVDISNYVMFELGRPSHIFDLDKIHGALDVRWAAGETLKLLDLAKGQPALAPRSSNRHLYTDASPLDGVPFEAKVRLLETIDAAARAQAPHLVWCRYCGGVYAKVFTSGDEACLDCASLSD